jgi:hypothetical protein
LCEKFYYLEFSACLGVWSGAKPVEGTNWQVFGVFLLLLLLLPLLRSTKTLIKAHTRVRESEMFM